MHITIVYHLIVVCMEIWWQRTYAIITVKMKQIMFVVAAETKLLLLVCFVSLFLRELDSLQLLMYIWTINKNIYLRSKLPTSTLFGTCTTVHPVGIKMNVHFFTFKQIFNYSIYNSSIEFLKNNSYMFLKHWLLNKNM